MNTTTATVLVGNTSPDVVATILSNGAPQDLTGCTVKIRFRQYGGTTTVVQDCEVLDQSTDIGKVKYEMGTLPLITAGTYAVEFDVYFPGDTDPETWPVDHPLTLTVLDRRT